MVPFFGIRSDRYRVLVSTSFLESFIVHKWWVVGISGVSWLGAILFAASFPVSSPLGFLCAAAFLVLFIFMCPLLVMLFISIPHNIDAYNCRRQTGTFTYDPTGLTICLLYNKGSLQQLVMSYIDELEICYRNDVYLPYGRLYVQLLWFASDAYRLENVGSVAEVQAFRKDLLHQISKLRMLRKKEIMQNGKF